MQQGKTKGDFWHLVSHDFIVFFLNLLIIDFDFLPDAKSPRYF